VSSPLVVETIAGIRSELDALRSAGRSIALVPTLGALHAGHLAHVARARELADVVVVSIFVNPLQFGANEDLAKYPRDLDGDLEQLGHHGVEYVFAPTAAEMYPDGGTQVKVTGGPVASLFEGRSRPGHFDGVLTVVAKLLQIVRPKVVTFGQKDAQQLFLVQRMVRDLNFDVAVEVIETVREADGVAMSSRNRYLGPNERMAARALSRAI
jgi:pantoate--beta-alanine ligase